MISKPMTALIIEDEFPNYTYVKQLFEQNFPLIKISGPLASVAEVKEYFALGVRPDFILADIKLADALVFEAFSDLQIDIPVIFTTAYNEFAIKAFDYNSIGYLLKPIEPEEFIKSINKIFSQKVAYGEYNLASLSEIAITKYRKRFLCPYKDEFIIIKTKDINHISLDCGTTKLYLHNGKSYNIDISMNELESQLDPEFFFRANRQFIIHIDAVEKLISYWGRKLKICLSGFPDVEVIVSKEKGSEIKKWLSK